MSLITKEAIEGKKVNIKEFYNLPEKVIHCSKCVVSNQRPRIILMKIMFAVPVNLVKLKIIIQTGYPEKKNLLIS